MDWRTCWGMYGAGAHKFAVFCGIFAWCFMFFPRFCWEFATSKNVTLHAEWEIKAEDSEPLDFRCAWGSIFCFRSWNSSGLVSGSEIKPTWNHEIMMSTPKGRKLSACPTCSCEKGVAMSLCLSRICLARTCCKTSLWPKERPVFTDSSAVPHLLRSSASIKHSLPPSPSPSSPSHCLPSWPSSRPAPHSRGLPGQSRPVLHLLWPRKLLASSKVWPQKHPRCSSQNAVVLWRLASEVRSAGTQGGWRFQRSSEDIGGLAAKLSQPPQCPAKLLLFIIHTHPKHVPCWAPSRCIASRCICCNQQGRCLFTSNPGRKIRPQANKNPEKHQESPRVTRIPNSIKITKPFCYRSSCLPNYPPTICLWLPWKATYAVDHLWQKKVKRSAFVASPELHTDNDNTVY